MDSGTTSLDADDNPRRIKRRQKAMDSLQKKLECPFTWVLDDVSQNEDYDKETHLDDELKHSRNPPRVVEINEGDNKEFVVNNDLSLVEKDDNKNEVFHHDELKKSNDHLCLVDKDEDDEYDEFELDEQPRNEFKEINKDDPKRVNIVTLIDSLRLAFVNVKKENFSNAKNNLEKASDILKRLDNYASKMRQENISRLVVTHIVESTWYYYYKAIAQESEASKAFKGLADLDQARRKYETGVFTLRDNGDLEATLNGCKAVFWSAYHDAGYNQSINYAKCALQGGGVDCALWHHVLGKSLRRRRRQTEFNDRVCPDEAYHLVKAYELDPTTYLYGMYAAQMYRDQRDFLNADEIYEKLYHDKIDNLSIRLRLALHFIRKGNLLYAEDCLNYAEAKAQNSMFFHYKGIYFEKQKDYKTAAVYIEKAAAMENVAADLHLTEILWKIKKDYDVIISHLEEVIKKFPNRPLLVQQVTLRIAMHFYFNKSNIQEAFNLFVKAIKMNPQSKQLKNYSYPLLKIFRINIFDFLYKIVLKFKKTNELLPVNIKELIKEMENLCTPHVSDEDNLQILYAIQNL